MRKIHSLDILDVLQFSCTFFLAALLIASVTDTGLPSGTSGSYNLRTKIVKADATDRLPRSVMDTCAHEIGHYVWHEHLTESERERYREIYNMTTAHVSTYALTGGVNEDFAETFMTGMVCKLRPELVPDDRERFFLEHVVPAYHGYGMMED